jgi:hypothetical protein
MNRQPVTSSTIKSIGFEPAGNSGTLEVECNSGAVWHYFNVPQLAYRDMMAAASVGKYFSANIKGTFREKRVLS